MLGRHKHPVALGIVTVLMVVLGRFAAAEDSPQSADDDSKFFENRIRPLLVEHCVRCHGEKAQKGKLRLDSRAALLAGGETGPAAVTGRPEESLLVEAINYQSLEMPPNGKLSDEQVTDLTEWVRRGMPWPDPPLGANARRRQSGISAEDRSYWSFQPLKPVVPPADSDPGWCRNEIDRFVFDKLINANLLPAPEADRRTLIRRACFDLHGLPPSAADVDAFLADDSPQAYERLIDRLLDSPRYGERWARHWLDLVRYAESDGFKQDAYRPAAWPYRDYVIRALNDDKPYDRFVLEQLAGDEVAPGDLDALAATSYLRHWIYEYNQRDVRTQWHNILNDVTDVTGEVFLGVSLGCARCHDHKFDPILQRDYFRFQAFFSPLLPRDDLSLATPADVAEFHRLQAEWDAKTAAIREERAALEKDVRQAIVEGAINKFPPDIRPMLRKAPAERTPYEQQLAELAYRQVREELDKIDFPKKLKGEAKSQWETLTRRLAEFDKEKPKALPAAFTVTDVGPLSSPTRIPGESDLDDIAPGILSVLDESPLPIPPASRSDTTGRRTALAQWITRSDNALTTRVIVNRLWQYHFGRGLVSSASDFGRLGDPPSHPELLDWLAADFVSNGWRFKRFHRLLMTSATYRQSSVSPRADAGKLRDPENRLLWRANPRRLDAEQIRDSLLAVSGELDLAMHGASAEQSSMRRTVYTKVLRNTRDPLLEVFDAPDGFNSTAQRNTTTTPTQSLLMINGPWPLARAQALANKLDEQSGDSAERVEAAYRAIVGRAPTMSEVESGVQFLRQQAQAAGGELDRVARRTAMVDLCHVLMNSNEFVYVD